MMILGLILAILAGVVGARALAIAAERRHQARLATWLGTPAAPIEPGPSVTIAGTLIGVAADDPPAGSTAMSYVMHGSYADDHRVPPASTTRTYASLGVRVGATTILLSGKLHLVAGSSSASGDRDSIADGDPSLGLPTNWTSVAVRKLSLGDHVRARGKLEGTTLTPCAFEDGEALALAHDPDPSNTVAVIVGAVAGAAVWLVIAALLWD